jgi:Mg2+/Co2+ transporter CorB
MTVPSVEVVGIASIVVLLALSAFFSSSEIAVFSLSPGWITDREATGDADDHALARLREDPHRLLVTLLVGNNLVNVALSSIVTVLLARYVSGGVAVGATTLVAGSVVLVFGEIVPKSFGLGNAERWAPLVARPIRLIDLALLPLVVPFDLLTRRLGTALGGDADIEEPYTDEYDGSPAGD